MIKGWKQSSGHVLVFDILSSLVANLLPIAHISAFVLAHTFVVEGVRGT